jgi:phosphoribosyl-AMP cyclohydrolase
VQAEAHWQSRINQNVWTDGLKSTHDADMRNIGESIDKINTVVIDFPPDSAYLCFTVG